MSEAALVPQSLLISLHTVELVAIVYLARALARLGERLSRLEGRNEERRGP